MAVELRVAGDGDEGAWDRVVSASPQGTLFHTWKWLKIAGENLDLELLPLMAYLGEHLLAVYPLFLHSWKMLRVADSPASEGFMVYLGPVIVDYEHMSQERREHTVLALQERVDHHLFSERGCKLVRVHLTPEITDTRPFIWSGYLVRPAYTYRIDLAKGVDRIWDQFDRKLKTDIRRAEKLGVRVREGDLEDLLAIHDALFRRFREKGMEKRECREYLHGIYEEFHGDHVRVFVAEHEGRMVGSVVALLYRDTARFWLGTPKSDMKGVYPNNLAQWEAMKWAAANGFRTCENMDTGDDPTRAPFKAKFNADLALWFKADKFSSRIFKLGHFLLSPDQH